MKVGRSIEGAVIMDIIFFVVFAVQHNTQTKMAYFGILWRRSESSFVIVLSYSGAGVSLGTEWRTLPSSKQRGE